MKSNVNWKYVRNVAIFIVLSFGILFLATYIHELFHANIFESYGCSHNIYFTWEGGRTAGMCNTNTTMNLTMMDVEHDNLESISYPIFYIGIPLIVIGLFFYFRKKDWL
jgi:hypothetical protein